MAKVFVSYSRKDIEFAKRLTAELQKRDLDFWIDWEGIPPTVDWWREIEKGIEEADIFLFFISPDSAKSKVCGQEIESAVKNAKRIIPLVVRDINGEDAPKQLSHLNWIFFRADDDFHAAVEKLITAIQTDYEWAATHRRLQVKALDWARNNSDNGFLLRGADLLDAEQDLAANTSKDPHPTDLQREYVFESRKATDRQRRLLTGISIAGVIALAVLAVFGFYQAGKATKNAATAQANLIVAQTAQVDAQNKQLLADNNAATARANEEEALRQARISRAGELSTLAVLQNDKQFDLALLFGIESIYTFENSRTRGTMLSLTDSHPALENFLFGHAAEVYSAIFTLDGKQLVTMGSDGTLIRWNINNPYKRSEIARFPEVGRPFSDISVSPDGSRLVSRSADGNLVLWDLSNPNSPTKIAVLPLGQGVTLFSAVLSPDASYLALESDQEIITLWDIRAPSTPALLSKIPGSSWPAFNPDGTQMAAGGEGGIILWDISDPTAPAEISTLESFSTGVLTFSYSGDGRLLVVGGIRTSIALWDIHEPTTPTLLAMLPETRPGITAAVFSPDGKRIATIASDNYINLWDISSPAFPHQVTTLVGHSKPVNSVAFSRDGEQLVSGGSDEAVILWDVADFKVPSHTTLSETTLVFRSASFSPDGKQVIADSPQGIARWDVNDPKTPKFIGALPPLGIDAEIFSTVFSPDGTRLASIHMDSSVTLMNLIDPETPSPLTFPEWDNISKVGFSADNGRMATIGEDNSVILWDIRDLSAPSQIEEFPGLNMEATAVAFSPDDHYLVMGRPDNSIQFWDIRNLASPAPSKVLFGHSDWVTALSFSRDGKTLVTGSWDQNIILWDISNPAAPAQLTTLRGRNGGILSVAIQPDGRALASVSLDGSLILWDLDENSWVEKACQRAGRNFTRAEWEVYFPNEEHRATCPQWPLEAALTTTPIPIP